MRQPPCCLGGAGAPASCNRFALKRGRAERRMRERIRSLMRDKKQVHEHSHHGHAASSGVPHAMVLTACCVSEPPVSDAECTTVTWTYGLRRRPFWERQLHPAIRGAGRRAGITRLGPSASDAAVTTGEIKKARSFLSRRARSDRPRIEHHARPPHPAPRIVTIAKRPSFVRRDRHIISEVWQAGIRM